jgi:hypothetical protein
MLRDEKFRGVASCGSSTPCATKSGGHTWHQVSCWQADSPLPINVGSFNLRLVPFAREGLTSGQHLSGEIRCEGLSEESGDVDRPSRG